MSATADRNTLAEHLERLVPFPIGSGTTIHAGTMVSLTFAGEAVMATDAAARTPVVGRSAGRADYASGDRFVLVDRGVFWWRNSPSASPVDANDAGKLVYVEDNETVRETPGSFGIVAGYCEGVDADDGVRVACLGGYAIPPFAAGTYDVLAAPGAASVATDVTILDVDGTDPHTLAAPTRRGQVKAIRTRSVANTPVSVVTVTGGDGFTTMSGFGTLNAFAILMATNADTPVWIPVASSGITFA